MPEHQPTAISHLAAIRRPSCPACDQKRMLLSRLEPGPPGYDKATFECPTCDRVQIRAVSHAVKASTTWGWLSGDRRMLF